MRKINFFQLSTDHGNIQQIRATDHDSGARSDQPDFKINLSEKSFAQKSFSLSRSAKSFELEPAAEVIHARTARSLKIKK